MSRKRNLRNLLTRRKRSRSRQHRNKQALQFESLEDRRMLALLGLTLEQPTVSSVSNNASGVTYNATTDVFSVQADPVTFFSSAVPFPVSVNAPSSFDLNFQVDSSGGFAGGVSGDDFILTGEIDIDLDGTVDVAGVLLTGEVTAFGFQNFTNPSLADSFDVRLSPTGGILTTSGTLSGGAERPNYFEGKDIGVVITAENSSFNGSFDSDFQALAKPRLGPIDAIIPPPPPEIEIIKKVKDPATGEFTDVPITFQAGSSVTFGYFVSNPGEVSFDSVVVVDDNATPDDASDDVDSDPGSALPTEILLVSGDDGNGQLDPGETWVYEFTRTAEFLEGNGGILGSVSEMNKYLLIGTTSNEIAKGVNVQNGDLGADIIVLSTEINDNVDFDLDDVFLHNAGSKWVDVDNEYNTQPDYLPGAAQVGEGVSWTGDVALTSPNAKFDMSNVELYGQVGVVADSSGPVSSVSNTLFFPDGVGDGFDNSGDGQDLPPNGVTANLNAEMAALRSELDGFENFVTNLTSEVTLSPGNGLPTQEGIEDVDVFELLVDPYDINGDGIAVIDILVDGGDSDFKITNSNWIIESENGTFAIFRILGDSNLVLNQSTILVGDGVDGNGGQDGVGPGGEIHELGAIFVKAAEYKDADGNFVDGEALDSGDTVFSFNDTVLNGVGFYDLIVFDDGNNDPYFDNGTTELKINNGQGCAHFISPKINFNDVRFERCALPEGEDEEQINTGEATGTASGETLSDSDMQSIIVSTTAPGSGANAAPVAANDGAYTVQQDGTLEQNGVLSNDTDDDGDALTAIVVDNPLNGSLDLQSDGTFTYTPHSGYSGTDYFTYQASDGITTSAPATVTIEVVADEAPAKRFYVVDTASDNSFVYNPDGSTITDFGLDGDNSASRGAAANVAGDLLWVIDRDKKVYLYTGEGDLQSKWKANDLDRPEGIATDEVHIWVVDRSTDRVYFYENGATATSDRSATTSFALAADNKSPRGITTDGNYLWVVNDTKTVDKVFKYSVAGDYLGSWAIDSANKKPRGITIDPSNVDHLWTVDASTDQVFMYESSVGRLSGSQSASSSFDLLAGNSAPQGIADPPVDEPVADALVQDLSDWFAGIGLQVSSSQSDVDDRRTDWNDVDWRQTEDSTSLGRDLVGSIALEQYESERIGEVEFDRDQPTDRQIQANIEAMGNELLSLIPGDN